MSSFESSEHHIKNGQHLVVREAASSDASHLLVYVEAVSSESDFLTFGTGEFELSTEEEENYLRKCHQSDNILYIISLVGDDIVSALNFAGGHRSRVRHSGEFGMSVRKDYWGLDVGSKMLDALIQWAREGQIITKINLYVWTDNARAIRLYEANGFVREGTITKAIFLDGQSHDHFWMGLEL